MSSPYEPTWESPSVEDVLAVKNILFQACGIPLEIIDAIIDFAEYWPHSSIDTSIYTAEKLSSMTARGGFPGGSRNAEIENVFVMRSLPIGILPEQIDPDTHLGITDGFTASPPKPIEYPESTDSTKSITEELFKQWSLQNAIRGTHPCRKIVFTIKSHDQGWGGSYKHAGTFEGSYTWFDVGLERVEACDPAEATNLQAFPVITNTSITEDPSHNTQCILRSITPAVKERGKFYYPVLPPDNHLIRNRTAHQESQEHVITWSASDDISPDDPAAFELDKNGRGKASGTGEFVRNLKLGDVITLWGRARFPGWANTIEYARIDVYWAV